MNAEIRAIEAAVAQEERHTRHVLKCGGHPLVLYNELGIYEERLSTAAQQIRQLMYECQQAAGIWRVMRDSYFDRHGPVEVLP